MKIKLVIVLTAFLFITSCGGSGDGSDNGGGSENTSPVEEPTAWDNFTWDDSNWG